MTTDINHVDVSLEHDESDRIEEESVSTDEGITEELDLDELGDEYN